jgi:hypothetical protein
MEMLFVVPVILVVAGLMLILVLAAASQQSSPSGKRDDGSSADGLFFIGHDPFHQPHMLLPSSGDSANADHSHASHFDHHSVSYDSGHIGGDYDAGGSFDGGFSGHD